jgi:subtilisin family serine protease
VDSDCDNHISTGAASFAFEFIGDYSPRPAVANYSARATCIFLGCGPTVDDAAKYARDRGVTVVVAAGNDGEDACDFTPAHVRELLTVGASDINDNRIVIPGWWSSNYGSCVDLFAPVENDGGTSLAAPMVTGVVALRLQAYPLSTPVAVEAEIISNSTQGVLSNIGSGSPNRLLYSKRPGLHGDISGPSVIGPSTTCIWFAVVSGGQSPFTYKWYRNGVLVSTTTQYRPRPPNSTFDLGLEVTDGVGRVSVTDMRVTVVPRNTQKAC